MHDLESFFCVLFWICIHYNGPNEPPIYESGFEQWNSMTTEDLAKMKSGTIVEEATFLKTMLTYATPYFQPLIPWLEELRKVVFPNDKKWRVEVEGLYEGMRDVLRKAMIDPKVRAV